MSRFWSKLLPDEIADAVAPVFEHATPIELIFGEEATIGPKNTAVHLIKNAHAPKRLHLQLVQLLNELGVTYTLPQFVGEGYLPHVSKRAGALFAAGSHRVAGVAYLVEVEIRGEDHLRYVRAKFDLNG